jgi:exodeoxyribonuclease-3
MHHGLLRGKTRGIYFYVIHFHPSNLERRIEEAGSLLRDIAQLPDRSAGIVLIGDFNGFSPADRTFYEREPTIEPFFAMLDERHAGAKNLKAGRLDYGGIERILEAGYVDVITRLRPPAGPFVGTFPTELRGDEDLGPDRRIDYIFVSPNLVESVRTACIIRDETTTLLSDHYPLEAVLGIP